jgi:integrase
MNKITAETAAKMMTLVDRSTYQGRITYLAIAFLSQTGLGLGELARLKVRDVYQLGIVRISLQAGIGSLERIVPLSNDARQTVAAILKAQACQGLQPYPWSPLIRTPGGWPFSPDQLARLLWLYREAAERPGAS